MGFVSSDKSKSWMLSAADGSKYVDFGRPVLVQALYGEPTYLNSCLKKPRVSGTCAGRDKISTSATKRSWIFESVESDPVPVSAVGHLPAQVTVVKYHFTGGDQFFTPEEGVSTIKMSVFGAGGGGTGRSNGGPGGLTTGVLKIDEKMRGHPLLITVGGGGTVSRASHGVQAGPYGGGGGTYRGGGTGGGLSGIFQARTFGQTPLERAATFSRTVIIAGGGGGGCSRKRPGGGDGGGLTGRGPLGGAQSPSKSKDPLRGHALMGGNGRPDGIDAGGAGGGGLYGGGGATDGSGSGGSAYASSSVKHAKFSGWGAATKNRFYSSGVGRAGNPKKQHAGNGLVVIEYEKPGSSWSYDGQFGSAENWHEYFGHANEMGQCDGNRQSPIDLSGSKSQAAKKRESLKFVYTRRSRAAKVHITNTGSTVSLVGSDLSGLKVSWKGASYHLNKVDFHHMSEHTLDGKRTPLEAQLMFKGQNGRILAMAILFKASKHENAFLDKIGWFKLPGIAGKFNTLNRLDLQQLVGRLEKQHFYLYQGSLTAPPCTQGVLWIVFKNPLEMSYRQSGIFPFISNTRPTQHLAGRKVTLV